MKDNNFGCKMKELISAICFTKWGKNKIIRYAV